MCLISTVESWDERSIRCTAATHRAADHPLRCDGTLSPVAAIEYGLQATAIHGALVAAAPQPAGYLVQLRDVELGESSVERFFGPLQIGATLLVGLAHGFMYSFWVEADGIRIVSGNASIILRSAPA